MKRTCLISCALATAALALAPSEASAEPAILYVPTDPVTLRPLSIDPCGATVNSAFGCGGASEETEEPPYADAAGLTTSLSDALVDFDVTVTNTRPPEYVSYTMLLPSDEAAPKSTSFTCAFGGIGCDGRRRNGIISTSGDTMNCMGPDVLHASLYAFGRVSGLEGVADVTDVMNYFPDYTMPMGTFTDQCLDRVNQQGFNDRMMQVELPLECTSLDHPSGCPDGMNGEVQQNSYQDMLAWYGMRTEDTDPPVLTNILPEDGTVLEAPGDLMLSVTIEDADPIVGVRWVVTSDAIAGGPGVDENNSIDKCTNDVCFDSWDATNPNGETGGDWSFNLNGVPAGDYVITLEAADYHGNVAEMVTINVTVEGGGGADTGTGTGGGNVDSSGGGGNVDFGDTTGDGGTGGTTSQDDDTPSGCSCRSEGQGGGSAFAMFLGLLGLGAMRRRWQ